ncbi:DUF2071 domain-containing protein [Roseivirga echinicomitans]|uniref:DUF2071 domain-containing protein n=1 Tax=Roseivirga echinicomitans TaxID=296218 RepID=A0A150XEL1_9BACT|nr:DUF2071 domain-containing protein [Roseivirga echinicomitans]KYG77140.1 hypothetical protein AWN68_18070 [Roseivirga echinicomitans]
MKIPVIQGVIDRRILINYQIDKDVLESFLPHPFKPKLVKGKGIAGICLIRLKEIRPKGLPKSIGISSENGAHRIAVEWESEGITKEGVYIPRRDTSSRLNAFAGGTLFPGEHHLADFKVSELSGNYEVSFESNDQTKLLILAKVTEKWGDNSIFQNINEASSFFEQGAVGYSPNNKKTFDGLELKTTNWKVTPLEVLKVESSFFDNEQVFPKGSVKFDNALLMKNISHEWIGLEEICSK